MSSVLGAVGSFIGGPVGGAIGSVLGGAFSSSRSKKRGKKAAKKAAAEQSNAALAAIEEQRRQYDQTRTDLQPWMEAGTGALGQQRAFLGLDGVDAQQAAYDNYQDSPGQAFLRAQGQKALLAGSSAIGGLGGGNVRKALNEYGIGVAAQDYGNHYNRLAGLSRTGQTTGTQLGQFGANMANQIGSNMRYGGEARASGILGRAKVGDQYDTNMLGVLGSVPWGDVFKLG